MSLNLQYGILQNAKDMQEYLKDLQLWEKNVNNNTLPIIKEKENKEVPIRSCCLVKSNTQLSLKRDETSVSDYYSAWSKFDEVRLIEYSNGGN